jgi:hypothetical protein
MKRPPVTQIFPGNNNGLTVPNNLPIRKIDSREHILNSGGFNPAHSIYHHSPFIPQTSSESRVHPMEPTQINCVDIARHIDACPICSRLYDTDKTLYILAILGLLILCFLMVKRIVKI